MSFKINNNLDNELYNDVEKLIITFNDGEIMDCKLKDMSNYTILVEHGLRELVLMKHSIKYIEVVKFKTTKVKLADIKISSTFKNVEVDKGVIDSIKACYSKYSVKPITIKFNNEGTPILIDGYKRYLALKELGKDEIKVKVEG